MSDNPRPVPLPAACQVVLGVFTAEPLDRDDSWELPPEPLLRRFGATDDDMAALRARPHVRLIHSTAPTSEAITAAAAARMDALELAADHDGIVVDLAIPRIIADTVVSIEAACEWVVFDVAFDTLESVGLAAFGLPELAWAGAIDASTAPATIAILTGLTHRIMTEWPTHDPVGPATVTLSDIAKGLGDAEPAPRDTGIEVTIDYDGTHLVITPATDPVTLFA